jgi:hypothetical protein
MVSALRNGNTSTWGKKSAKTKVQTKAQTKAEPLVPSRPPPVTVGYIINDGNLVAIGHNPKTLEMGVLFKTWDVKILYTGVPHSIFQAIMKAENRGEVFQREISNVIKSITLHPSAALFEKTFPWNGEFISEITAMMSKSRAVDPVRKAYSW